MDSDAFTDQEGLSVHGIRDVRSTVDGKQHDWSEQAEATETDTLSTDLKSYTCIGVLLLRLVRTRRLAEIDDYSRRKRRLYSRQCGQGFTGDWHNTQRRRT